MIYESYIPIPVHTVSMGEHHSVHCAFKQSIRPEMHQLILSKSASSYPDNLDGFKRLSEYFITISYDLT